MRVPAIQGVISTIILSLALGQPPGTAEDGHRQWGFAQTAAAPCPDGRPASATYAAPDGKKALITLGADGSSRVYLAVEGARHALQYAAWPCPEFQWSADSKAFFLNYSNGGTVGEYDVKIYYPSRDGVRTIDPTRSVRQDFRAHYPKCFSPETPNIAGVAWLEGSRRLLVAAQVLPHSNCDAMGTFAAYEVEIPSGNILRKHGQLEAKSRFWELLGPELRRANDACIRDSESCWIPALHGG